jgi:hypothetical protein
MNEENTKKLFNRFDFFQPSEPITRSLMAFGFECGDGWFQLIWDLCEKIEEELKNIEIAPKEETKRLLRGQSLFNVVQVKEKFGTLRFYAHGGNDKIDELIRKAENKSAITCEKCGKEAKPVQKDGWYATLCTSCSKDDGFKPVRKN